MVGPKLPPSLPSISDWLNLRKSRGYTGFETYSKQDKKLSASIFKFYILLINIYYISIM